MRTITLYSNIHYNSGTQLDSVFDSRWPPITHDLCSDPGPRMTPGGFNSNPINNTHADYFQYILYSVGINCEYTDEIDKADAIVVDVGSHPNWFDYARQVTTQYNGRKIILFSSQEPCTQTHRLLEQYKNLYIMDAVMIAPTEKPIHKRHIPFPSFFSRMVNPFFNIVVAYHTINFANTERKRFVYNSLKFRNELPKTLTQYFLYREQLLDSGIVTYKRDNGNLVSKDIHVSTEAEEHLRKGVQNENKQTSCPIDVNDVVDFYLRHNDNDLESDSTFHKLKRYQPLWVLDESYFSVVNESMSGCKSVLFTEKTLYPLMLGHPLVVVNQNQNYVYQLLEQLGFELHRNILSYTDSDNLIDSIRSAVANIKTFDKDNYVRTLNETVRISNHNRANFLNTHSTLWLTLRELMISNLHTYMGTK